MLKWSLADLLRQGPNDPELEICHSGHHGLKINHPTTNKEVKIRNGYAGPSKLKEEISCSEEMNCSPQTSVSGERKGTSRSRVQNKDKCLDNFTSVQSMFKDRLGITTYIQAPILRLVDCIPIDSNKDYRVGQCRVAELDELPSGRFQNWN